MRLTSIFLYPDLGEFKTDAALSFRNQTRFICHYVQEFVAARKVQTSGFNKICVVCKSVASESSRKNSSNTLAVEVPFQISEYEKIARDNLPEYFIGLLKAGLVKCSKDQHLSTQIFDEAIESFRVHGYKNAWVHLARSFRPHGLKCRLLCELDMDSFRLTLEVERKGELLFFQEVLRTLPDEVVYAHRFKDMKLEGHTLLVQDKFGESLFALNVLER